MNSPKILILGGDGFVGKNVFELLKQEKVKVATVSRRTGVDLRDLDKTQKALKKYKPDFVINCAAHVGSLNYVTELAAEVILDNSKMILTMYEAIQKTSPKTIVINPVANCAYAPTGEIFVEDLWQNGPVHSSVFAYGSAKRLLWAAGESFKMQHGLKSVYLLVPNMYGPHDSTDPNKAHALDALVSKFVKAKKKNEKEITIWGTGVAIREWLYAGDFARIVYEVIKNPILSVRNEITNVGQNFGLSIKELIAIIKKLTHYEGIVRYDTTMPDGTPKKVMDDKRFRHFFPEFEFMPLNSGIKKTIEYYESIFPY